MGNNISASPLGDKKAFLFAAAWMFKKKFDLRKYPEIYGKAKSAIGQKADCFGFKMYPKERYSDRKLYVYYRALWTSLQNNDYRIDPECIRLLTEKDFPSNYTLSLDHEICCEIWVDSTRTWTEGQMPYSHDSISLARKIFDEEDFGLCGVLADSLEDTGHSEEAQHFLSGTHTPACSLLRQIKAKSLIITSVQKEKVFQF